MEASASRSIDDASVDLAHRATTSDAFEGVDAAGLSTPGWLAESFIDPRRRTR